MIPVGSSQKTNRFAYVNLVFIILNFAAFIYVFYYSGAPVHITERYGFIPARFFSGGWNPIQHWGKYLTLVTACFLHGGLLHIAGNMLFLWVFGAAVEDRIGSGRYLVFYLLLGVISLLVHGYMFRSSTLPLVGASGAIAGIMGAFYILFPTSTIKTSFLVLVKEISAVYFLFIWFLWNLVRGILRLEGAAVDMVAWWAHVGGFLAGVVLINIFAHNVKQGKPSKKSKKSKKKKK